ncbi:uncharacterized protein LOC130679535 [Manis pentadactyla]|uniref:uncharacterized protein LOC130679535 n=1 Tax=Manis pentadactyla TaxID=143292 RepID=UPI00255CAF37|nr:uncharacterized protein LOC130679535 [Manis pentadactyla]
MVRDRARAARLGPVRPATSKGQEEEDRALDGTGLRSGWAGEGCVSRQDPLRAGIREAYRCRAARSSGDHELKTLFGEVTSRRRLRVLRLRLRSAAPEAAAAALTSTAARFLFLRGCRAAALTPAAVGKLEVGVPRHPRTSVGRPGTNLRPTVAVSTNTFKSAGVAVMLSCVPRRCLSLEFSLSLPVSLAISRRPSAQPLRNARRSPAALRRGSSNAVWRRLGSGF